MLSIFLESLPLGWPCLLAGMVGLLVGLKFRFKRMGISGLVLLLASVGVIVASLFLVPELLGDCRTERGHALLSAHMYATFALTWMSAFGAGLLVARVWMMNRTAGVVSAIAAVLASIPFGYIAVFAVAFRPGCYV